jgi:hypothetical protein
MREGHSRAVRPRSELLFTCAALLASALFCGAGCATEVNPLESRPPAEQSIDGGEPGSEGGSTAAAGSAAMAGKPSGGSGGSSSTGGTGVNAFGGTASTGGKGGGGSGGSAGSEPSGGGSAGSQGGTATGGKGGSGSAGTSQGGSGGMPQGGSGRGGAGAAGGGSAGSSGLGCLSGWKGSACDTCSTQTQGDKLGCVTILECYEANSCGPATCANNDDKCGVNKMGQGTAGYPIAKDVYDCACP